MDNYSGEQYMSELRRRVDAGDLDAFYELGAAYDLGELVPLDKGRASRIFKAAADLGHAHSMWIHACELLWGGGESDQCIPEGFRYLDASICRGLSGCLHHQGADSHPRGIRACRRRAGGVSAQGVGEGDRPCRCRPPRTTRCTCRG